ncbi:MAG: outer membrane beta-barrel protein [Holosporales bacterium]|jgi:opacity protein-like surface antigen|nr:outer membrane beta-barrel protein [Holosporales bacterium]
MKKFITAIMMLVFSNHLIASDLSSYVSIKGSLGFPASDKYYPNPIGYGVTGALGLNLKVKDTYMRTEFEFSALSYKKAENKDDQLFEKYNSLYGLSTNLYMFNLYADLLKKDSLGLYIGAGIGLVGFKEIFSDNLYFYGTDINVPSEFRRTKSAFVYGIGIGIYFDITKNLIGDTGVRCVNIAINDKIIICDATFGLRYAF